MFVVACFLSFALCVPWQPWAIRLQVPLFAFSAPLFFQAFQDMKYLRWRRGVMVFLCLFSLLPLFLNWSRPIFVPTHLPVLRGITSEYSIWNTERDKLVFTNKPFLYEDYTKICDFILKDGDAKVGLIIDFDSWEYPFWRSLRNLKDKEIEITHQRVEAIAEDVNYLILFNSHNLGMFISDEPLGLSRRPWLFCRNKEELNRWDVVYQPLKK